MFINVGCLVNFLKIFLEIPFFFLKSLILSSKGSIMYVKNTIKYIYLKKIITK